MIYGTHLMQSPLDFVRVLNECRVGLPSPRSISILRGLDRDLDSQPFRPVQLYALRGLVDRTNSLYLDMLPGQLYSFRATNGPDHSLSLPYYNDMPVDPLLVLKNGTQVMLRKNLGNGLVNGTIGKVVSFHTEEDLLKFGNDYARYTGGPLRRIDPSTLPSSSSMPPNAYPVICFKTSAGSEHVFCQPEIFQVEDQHGQIVAMRTQVCSQLPF